MRIASVRGGGRFTGRISSAAAEPLFYSPRGGLGRPAELRSPRKQTGDLAVLRAYPLVHLLVPIRSTLLNIFQSLPQISDFGAGIIPPPADGESCCRNDNKQGGSSDYSSHVANRESEHRTILRWGRANDLPSLVDVSFSRQFDECRAKRLRRFRRL